MLVLSRNVGEAIVVGGDVVVSIVDVRGDRVKLGVEAPKTIPVHRREVQDRLQADGDHKAA